MGVRRECATVVGLDDQVRDSRRAAGMANHDTLRVAHEEAQREGQEFLERSRGTRVEVRASTAEGHTGGV